MGSSVGLSPVGLLFFLGLFLQISAVFPRLFAPTDSLHHFLSDFAVVRPIRTDSEGRVLPDSTHNRSRRHAHWPHPQEQEVFYNLTLQGAELQLRLQIRTQLTAPDAVIVWEESGVTQPITEQHCIYTGHASNDSRITVAVSNCRGLEGVILTPHGEFYIEPLLKNCTEENQEHIIYRSSDLIRADQTGPWTGTRTGTQEEPENQNQDFFRGPVLGSDAVKLHQSEFWSGSVQNLRRRRFIEEAELFHIEVLLAVDYSVVLFHGRENVQRYLLTIINIVNEIYQEPSLGANINIVLVQIVLLSPAKSHELISVGNPQKSLEKVCTWSFLHQREQPQGQQHDHTIYLSRQEFGPAGMRGYAPVTGMCQLIRSCVLVIDDGFSSAFVAAHETGHVLGMGHDGEANDCEDDVHLGSIMSPQVQASFYRYHWSRCSWRELHQYLASYECLRDDPFLESWPLQPQLPGFLYSMDQQCQYDFGPGFSTCTAYTVTDVCKQLWCSHYNNPFYCKTKKGPPLDGTHCGPGQHCFRGNCMRITPDLLRTHGAWGKWSSFGACSRTCHSGVQFRTRRCDSPSPDNGGRTCFGNSYEFRLCNQDQPCPPLTDFRADQCKVWNPFFELNGTKHHWLPFQHPDPDERCQLFCQSKETSDVVSMNRMVHDGTLCSYEDQHSVCVRGECEHVGCDGQVASDRQEDRCGVCGGDNSSCKIIKGNFTRSARKNGFLKILEIPKGARHLLIQEFKSTPHVLAVKNLETGHLFLNDEHHFPVSRVVVEGGVAWEYVNEEHQESVQTSGPLSYSILFMVRSHGEAKVTVSYKYIIQDALRSSLESNLLQEDAIFYEWALKMWSHCSRPCGGGKQYTRFGCRRKADGKMVHRMFCSNISKPRAISRNCNSQACSQPKWAVGQWELCSASCGHSGWQRRWVSCQQNASGEQYRSVPSKLCSGVKPESKRSCNREACPAVWRSGPWTPCSVRCGVGSRERQVKCLSPEGSPGNCSAAQPVTVKSCQAPPCTGEQRNSIVRWLSKSSPDLTAPSSSARCRGDRSVFCRMEVLIRYCSIPGYRQMCCITCGLYGNETTSHNTTTDTSHNNLSIISNTSRNNPSVPGNMSSDISSSSPTELHRFTNRTSHNNYSTVSGSAAESSTERTSSSLLTTLPPDDLTALAPPPDDLTALAPPPDDLIALAPPPDDLTALAPPPDDITSSPTETPRDFVYVDYSEDYSDFSSFDSDFPGSTESTVATTMAQTPITSTTTTKRPRENIKIDLNPLLFRQKTSNNSSSSISDVSSTPSSVSKVSYTVVGLSESQQSEFVPRKRPHFGERTQNKRIEELLREKRQRLTQPNRRTTGV